MRFLIIFIFTISIFGSTLNLATSTNPARLNPLIATDSSSSSISSFIFSSLLKYDENATNIIGDLASSYRFITPTKLEFNLRRDVLWHDGAPFSSKDVVFTYDLIKSPQIATPYSSDFRVVKSVVADGDYRVIVEYEKPYFKALNIWMMGIVPEHILKDEKNIMGSAFNTNPIGTGAYKLEKLEFSKSIKLSAFDRYYEGKAGIDTINFIVLPDPLTRFLMLKSNKIDISSLEPMQYDRQLDSEFRKNYKSLELPSHSYTYLGFNLKNKKFSDPRVREALSLAIDRDEIIDILFLGHGRVCTGPFLPGSNGFNSDIKPPKKDIKRAKKLLLEAGYSDKNRLKFEIATSNSNSIRPYMAEIIQKQLSHIGVEVSIKTLEWQAFLNTIVMPRNFDSVLLGWSLSVMPDPYSIWHSDSDRAGGFNFIGYHSSRVDALIEQMENLSDQHKIASLQREIFAEIAKDNPYLFLVIPNDINVYSKDIEGIKPSINGIWNDYIKWKKR